MAATDAPGTPIQEDIVYYCKYCHYLGVLIKHPRADYDVHNEVCQYNAQPVGTQQRPGAPS